MNIRKKTLILLLSACCSVASQTVAMTARNDVSTYNTNFNDHKEEKKEAEKKKKNVSKADEIIAHAMRYRGKAYRRGASGPNAFDCSGFTGFVFRKANIELKRSSREQFTQGVAVNRSDLQPGDLVFFSSPRSGRVVVCKNRFCKGFRQPEKNKLNLSKRKIHLILLWAVSAYSQYYCYPHSRLP